MIRRTSHQGCCPLTLAAAALIGTAEGAHGQDARVDVTVDGSAVAHVLATYLVSRDGTLQPLLYLHAPCAAVSELSTSRGAVLLEPAARARGPWVDVRVASGSPSSGSPGTLTVSYLVRLSARVASIPLVLPAAPLESPAVISLRLSPSGARPVLPRLERAATTGLWSATLRALPSAVRVDLGSESALGPCAEATPRGNAGTLDVRFTVFVATLVLWIPLYFWWASRQPDRR